MTIETKEMIRRRKVKKMIASAVVGAALALACKALPPEYQGPCETVLHICTGGF